jgi:hypothetical protein
MNPKRVHSICTIDWYAKLGSTTYYTRPYPYRLMVVLFSWVCQTRFYHILHQAVPI